MVYFLPYKQRLILGELFTIRVAGNVINDFPFVGVEYAADHPGTNLIVVLGHTNCGAVGAAMGTGAEGLHIPPEGNGKGWEVIGAVCHIDDGHVEFL